MVLPIAFLAGCVAPPQRAVRSGADLRRIIAEQAAQGAPVIVVPPGDYRVTPVDQVHLTLRNLHNCELRMDGVRMICTETTRALDVRHCDNLIIRGLTIDYDPLPFTQFVITRMGPGKRWLDLRLPAGYGINDLVTHADLGHLVVIDPQSDHLKVIYGGPERIEKTGPGRYRYTKHDCYRYDPAKYTEGVGDVVIVNNHHAPGGRENHAVLVGGCTNLLLADIRVHAAPMMAFFEGSCDGVTYLRCINDRCPPEQDYRDREIPRYRSSGRDGFHLLANRGTTVLDGCVSRYMDDDGVNIHGSGNPIDHIDGTTAVVGDKHGRLTVAVDDAVELVSFRGVRLGPARITAISRGGPPSGAFLELWKTHIFQNRLAPTRTWVIELDRAVPGAGPGTFLYAPDRVGSHCIIRNCTFGFTRSRGIVLRGSHALVENNTIEGNWEKGIMVTGDFTSLEGGFPSHVRVIDNDVASLRAEAIYMGFISPYGDPAPPGLYRDVTITGNTLGGRTADLHLTSIRGLTVEGNTSPGRPAPLIVRNNCEE